MGPRVIADGRLLPAVLLAVLIGGGGGPALAQGSDAASVHARMDLDGDGAIDVDELRAVRARAFNEMDRDLNNQLTESEFVALWIDKLAPAGDPRRDELTAKRGQRFVELDKNADGTIAKTEYLDVGTNRFHAADRNGDGRLSLEEFEGNGRQ